MFASKINHVFFSVGVHSCMRLKSSLCGCTAMSVKHDYSVLRELDNDSFSLALKKQRCCGNTGAL